MSLHLRSRDDTSLWEGLSLLRCPACEAPLIADRNGLSCDGCDGSWPVGDGAILFGGEDRRPHGLALAQRHAVARAADAHGWQTALHDVLRLMDAREYRLAVDEYRAQWRFLLPVGPDSAVLDLSCGWGAAALNLAETCRVVVAADACPAQARFLALRAAQMGRENLLAVQLGLGGRLPFARQSFDLAVVVDAIASIEGSREQEAVMSGIRATLKPGGSLFLADANSLSCLFSGRRSYAHTLGGYCRLLRQAGFHDVQVFGLLPSHLLPFFMAPLGDANAFAHFVRGTLASHISLGRTGLKRVGLGLAAGVMRRAPAGTLRPLASLMPSFGIWAR